MRRKNIEYNARYVRIAGTYRYLYRLLLSSFLHEFSPNILVVYIDRKILENYCLVSSDVV